MNSDDVEFIRWEWKQMTLHSINGEEDDGGGDGDGDDTVGMQNCDSNENNKCWPIEFNLIQ